MSSRAVTAPDAEIVLVGVAGLRTTPSFRESGLSEEHVDRLFALGGLWPPLLVDRGGVVIDGAHRLAAAERLGMAEIEVCYFDGGEDEALVEFVRRNVAHGLTLTLRERKQAARQMLGVHPEWSDRRVARICAISPKTVGRIRLLDGERPTEENPHLDAGVRVGLDNRVRPVNNGSARPRVLAALMENPAASLRAVAANVGVSPETVRLVRKTMEHCPTSEPPSATPAPCPPEPVPSWDRDAALLSFDDGDFVGWLDATAVDDRTCAPWIETLPLSRVYEVADEARRRSAVWAEFAQALEARTAGRT